MHHELHNEAIVNSVKSTMTIPSMYSGILIVFLLETLDRQNALKNDMALIQPIITLYLNKMWMWAFKINPLQQSLKYALYQIYLYHLHFTTICTVENFITFPWKERGLLWFDPQQRSLVGWRAAEQYLPGQSWWEGAVYLHPVFKEEGNGNNDKSHSTFVCDISYTHWYFNNTFLLTEEKKYPHFIT